MHTTSQISKRKLRTDKSPGKMIGVQIASTGIYLPSNVVRNEDLASQGFDSDWIIQRTGIRERRHVEPGQATSDLAIGAAKDCIEKSNVAIDDIDLILVATMTPDHFTPSTACLVQASLGATCGALDVNAACSGFLYALMSGSQFIKTGSYKNVLVIGAETMSMIVDPEDKKTYPLFGDGAAAVLLTEDWNANSEQASGILSFRLASVGELADSLVVPGCGSRNPASTKVVNDRDQFLKMDGRTVFKWAVRTIPEIVDDALSNAGLKLDDLKLLIFHQANQRILKAATDDLQIDPSRIFMNVDKYGNTSAASVAISLHEAYHSGQIERGDHVLLAGFGAGLTWASCIFRW